MTRSDYIQTLRDAGFRVEQQRHWSDPATGRIALRRYAILDGAGRFVTSILIQDLGTDIEVFFAPHTNRVADDIKLLSAMTDRAA
jgi:hypothetical protein